MTAYLEIMLENEPVLLLPQKALFRPLRRQLVLGDVHLGKASHFRKQGIPLPPQSHLKDIDTLHYLVDTWKPESVVLLGDLFHSSYNREWLWFKSLLMHYPQVNFILVEGNHDILEDQNYELPNLIKVSHLEEEQLVFTHHPLHLPSKLNVCAHIHPGVFLSGQARQSVKLACFYKSGTHLILPAFGNLTGLKMMDLLKDVSYYLIAEGKVIPLQLNF